MEKCKNGKRKNVRKEVGGKNKSNEICFISFKPLILAFYAKVNKFASLKIFLQTNFVTIWEEIRYISEKSLKSLFFWNYGNRRKIVEYLLFRWISLIIFLWPWIMSFLTAEGKVYQKGLLDGVKALQSEWEVWRENRYICDILLFFIYTDLFLLH